MMEPIYDSRVQKIRELLKFKTRDEAAAELGYKTYKSLDMYMRRKHFTFDTETNQYVPKTNAADKLSKDPKSYAPTKVVSIITAFEEAGADPKLIAKKEGFRDHKEMAEYMTNKGYEWNAHHNNYVKTIGKVEDTTKEFMEQAPQAAVNHDIDEYMPFIRFLYEKRDDIYQMISGTKEDGTIPRYVIPGIVKTKAIYMSDMVAKLTAEFSKERNISQREIMEGALIEYLQKYGFKREVETLLKNQ